MSMNFDLDRIFEIVDDFLSVPSIVGFEKPFLLYMKKKAEDMGYKTNLGKNYNYLNIKSKNQNKSNILFSAHIDRQGLVLTDEGEVEYATNYVKRKRNLSFRRQEQKEIENKLKDLLNDKLKNDTDIQVFLDDYFLRFKSESFGSLNFFRQDGPVDSEKIALRYVGESVIAYKMGDLEVRRNGGDEYKIIRYDLDWKKHKIMFDFDRKIEKEDEVFMFKSNIKKFENKFSAQIDNVISAAVLFYLMEKKDFDADILFTCGEEMGESYKSIIDYYADFDLYIAGFKLVVLDTSPYPDFIGKENGFLVLRHGDERSGFNENLVGDMKSYLDKENIAYDFKPSFLGRTELGKVAIESQGRLNGATLQLPTLNYHTTYETSTIKSLENYVKVIDYISK